MKLNSPFYVLAFCMMFLIFSTPFIALSQQTAMEKQAIEDAKQDVETHINKPMWFAIGCLMPGFGLLGPYLYRPPVPAGRTIGKPAEYVAFYSDTYKSEMEKLQFQYALTGCTTGVVLQGCLLVFWLAIIGAN